MGFFQAKGKRRQGRGGIEHGELEKRKEEKLPLYFFDFSPRFKIIAIIKNKLLIS